MPKQTTDRNTTWSVNQNNLTWTLSKSATIDVDNQYGIFESGSGNTIVVLGDIKASGTGFGGVRFQGSDSTVQVGAKGLIDARQADYGIYSEGAGSDIVNRGLIQGDLFGVYGAIWNDVSNYGTIKGTTAIAYDGDGSQIYNYGRIEGSGRGIVAGPAGTFIMNDKGASVTGGDFGILFTGLGDAKVVNKGTIEGDNTAVFGGDGDLTLVNRGRIEGLVSLGGGEDTLDTRGGTIVGKVFGGGDNDTFLVDSSRLKIIEEAGGGTDDQVISSVSYRLSAEIEGLRLIGGADANATGNGGANTLEGNRGDNAISGKGGADMLTGFAGDDRLSGGEGMDTFRFASGYDVDTITDFEDGTDLIAIEGVASQADFDALDIKQQRGDLVINLGGGDRLVIEDMVKSDLTWTNDFTAF
jgi:Ca2+-binding RTX toxin-like protein